MSQPVLDDAKRRLRAGRPMAGAASLGHRMAGHVLEGFFRLGVPPGAVVSGFWPLADEIDPRPLMLALSGRGHPLCLPRTPKRGLPLAFHAWRWGAPLLPGRLGILEPAPDAPACEPDLLLVPMVAFDRRLNRLGHGAGFFDRTLAALRATRPVVALGIAFAAQEVPLVPTAPHDQRLDAVATEAGLVLP